MRFVSIALLSSLVAAKTLLGRQDIGVTIVSATADGPGCPADSVTFAFSLDRQAVDVIFSRYLVATGPDAPDSERETFCDISLAVAFPLGCTSVVFDTIYRGLSTISEMGVSGHLTSSSTLSPGQLIGGNPPETMFTSTSEENFVVEQKPSGTERISNANEQIVSFVSRSRLNLISTGPSLAGVIFVDSVGFDLGNQTRCT